MKLGAEKLPKEILQHILQDISFLYTFKMGLRLVCKFFKNILDTNKLLLKTAQIINAQKYIQEHDSSPKELQISDQIKYYTATIHPCDNTQALLRFKYKWVDSETGEPTKPGFEEEIPLEQVLFFSNTQIFSECEYNELEERKDRHHFITFYNSLPNSKDFPRTMTLKYQSLSSLERLKESLTRYQCKIKELLPEIQELIQCRKYKTL